MKITLKNLMIVILGGFVIIGCGRKGALEVPSSVGKNDLQEGVLDSKSKAYKPFVLDWLIQ